MASWTPNELRGRGLVGWWDARHAPSRTLDANGRVTAWRDRCRNVALSTGATGPLYRSSGWLDFDASNRQLQSVAQPFPTGEATAFAVCVPDLTPIVSGSSPRVLGLNLSTFGVDYGAGAMIVLAIADTSPFNWFTYSNAMLATASGRGDDTPVVVGASVSSGRSVIRVNGTSGAVNTTTFTASTSLLVRVGYGNNAQESYRGLLGEIVLFDRVLPAYDVAQIERYLAAKWRISLSGAHPTPPRPRIALGRLPGSTIATALRTSDALRARASISGSTLRVRMG